AAGTLTVLRNTGAKVAGRVTDATNPTTYSGAITAATNATPIEITSAGHGLADGARVRITGVVGNTAANGTWTITKVNNDKFTLNGSVGNGAYTSGGKWVQGGDIADASDESPIKVTSPGHGLNTGDKVIITGVQGNTAANGTFTITKIDD